MGSQLSCVVRGGTGIDITGRRMTIIVGLFSFIGALSSATAQSPALPNGVAAGDVDQTSAVLWMRSTQVGMASFEFGLDPNFESIDRTVEAEISDTHAPVKVEVEGLEPGTLYHYRVTDAGGGEAVGQFRTAAIGGFHGLRFGGSGCGRADLTPYMSVTNAPQRALDFFIFMGDTIYADWPWDELDPDVLPPSQSRTPAEFRSRHNDVYTERLGLNPMADLRQSTAMFAMIDDHEVTNDYAGGAPASSDLRFEDDVPYINESELYRNGLSAFQEYYPIRDEFYGETGDPRTAGKRKLYRYRTFGSDAALFILDARSFRDPSFELESRLVSKEDYVAFLERSFDASRTMLGETQLLSLERDLLDAHSRGITWKFIVLPEPIQLLGPGLAGDRFEGYAFERSRILRFIDENDVANVVFFSSDIHTHLVNQLTYQDGPRSRQKQTGAFEVVAGPVAFAAPFGPSVMKFAPAPLRNLYYALVPNAQNDLYKTVGDIVLDFYGLPRIGLRNAPVDARLIEGKYLSVNTYGWSEFDIDARTQCLTVTSWGVPWYTPNDVLNRPQYVRGLKPRVVGRFVVQPRIEPGSVAFDEGVPRCPFNTSPCGAIDLAMLGMMPALYSLGLCQRSRRGRCRL